jgi:hypothetical protein
MIRRKEEQPDLMFVLKVIGASIIIMVVLLTISSIIIGCAAPQRAGPTDLHQSVQRMPMADADTIMVKIGDWFPFTEPGMFRFVDPGIGDSYTIESVLYDGVVNETFRYKTDSIPFSVPFMCEAWVYKTECRRCRRFAERMSRAE